MRRRAFDPFESMRRHIESFFDDDLFDFDDDPFFQMPMHSFFRFGPSPRPSRRVPPAARASNAREIPITFADSPELHQRSGRPPLIEEIPLDEGEHHNPVRRRSIVSVEEPEEVDAEEPEEPIEYVPRTHYSSSTVMSYADSSGRATTVSSETRMAPDGHLETRRRVRETNGEDKETFEVWCIEFLFQCVLLSFVPGWISLSACMHLIRHHRGRARARFAHQCHLVEPSSRARHLPVPAGCRWAVAHRAHLPCGASSSNDLSCYPHLLEIHNGTTRLNTVCHPMACIAVRSIRHGWLATAMRC
ncbi:hypothetical protein PBRA_003074 [Plasmodiophora brassicae]|uniref:Uncharacterized protein n=1 Tax=Plasmodiophora brassicae TaxID=37360 RepID=A0A0G4J7H7_PLABS|nr:hypothetical protein PBRA_003074 [Plasmodiophora brassicae]